MGIVCVEVRIVCPEGGIMALLGGSPGDVSKVKVESDVSRDAGGGHSLICTLEGCRWWLGDVRTR